MGNPLKFLTTKDTKSNTKGTKNLNITLITIAKDFRWEMAHRLPFHTAGCQNIHGHSYCMTVEIAGELGKNGMVMDYLLLKEIVQPFVDEIDHSFLCDASDEVVATFLAANSMKRVLVAFPTTAENIAKMFTEKIGDALMTYKNVFHLSIRIAETENTYAQTSRELRVHSPAHVL